jgi:SAM-dependent MidA family methyltransferase
VRRAGEEEGMITEEFMDQGRFLTRLGSRLWRPEAAFGDWTPERTRQFQTLVHPGHLGMKFQVLVQRLGEPCLARA